MESYPPFNVYKNIPAFLETRKLKTNHKFQDYEEFIKTIQYENNITVIAEDSSDKIRRFFPPFPIEKIKDKKIITMIIIMGLEDNYVKKTSDFLKFINNKIRKYKDILDIIIITNNLLNTNIVKRIYEDITNRDIPMRIVFYPYDKFKINQMKHKLSAIHEIMSEEEEKNLLERGRINKNQLPKIVSSDAKCIWIGGEPGEIIRIISKTEISLERYSYRLVC
ncbi:MAG: DNA-directed RNA polymerase subunit RpoH/Rpb5 C-terminal domain-containing protein [Nitrososphaerota archaeon]